jgi:hypothetical protein
MPEKEWQLAEADRDNRLNKVSAGECCLYERERCAKTAERYAKDHDPTVAWTAREIAKLIRDLK